MVVLCLHILVYSGFHFKTSNCFMSSKLINFNISICHNFFSFIFWFTFFITAGRTRWTITASRNRPYDAAGANFVSLLLLLLLFVFWFPLFVIDITDISKKTKQHFNNILSKYIKIPLDFVGKFKLIIIALSHTTVAELPQIFVTTPDSVTYSKFTTHFGYCFLVLIGTPLTGKSSLHKMNEKQNVETCIFRRQNFMRFRLVNILSC